MQSGAVTYLLVLTVTFMYHSVAGELIITPRNTEAKVGETTYLNCSTNEAEEIFWYHGEASIYHAYKILEPYIGRFEIDRNASNGSHNLVIYSVQPSDAGKYICIDKDGLGGRQSAELIVLENDPDCHSDMQPDGIIGQNVFNIPPDEAQLTCNVSYYGNIPPQMEWKKVEGHSSVKDRVTSNVTYNNRLICTLKIKGDFTMDNSSYVCETTRSTQNQYKCTSENIKVLYFIGGNMIEQNVFKGDKITCAAKRNTFSCINQWHYDNYTLNETITTQLLGEYLCQVKCRIRGTNYTFDAMKAFVAELKTPVPDKGQSALPMASGTIVAAAVVAFVIIVIISASIAVLVERHRRGKDNGKVEQSIELLENSQSKNDDSKETNGKVADVENELLHKIKGDVNDAEEFSGNTILNETLFVALKESAELKVYNCNDFNDRSLIEVKGLKFVYDICSCKINNCIYIMDSKTGDEPCEVLRISTDGNVVGKWLTEDNADGTLSTTAEGNVIITVKEKSALLEYLHTGKLERVVDLPDCPDLWHAIKQGDRYVVSHGAIMNPWPRVCLVDKEGNVEKFFSHQIGSAVNRLSLPAYLAVGMNGCVIVADAINSQLLLLDSNLEFKTTIVPNNRQMFQKPMSVCVSEMLLVVSVAAGVSCNTTHEETSESRNGGDTSAHNNDFPIESDCKILVFNIQSLLKKYCG